MNTSQSPTLNSIDRIAAAVFGKPDAWVVEAYSDFDALPLQFHSAPELARYAKQKVAKENGSAMIFVVYPDMGARGVRQTIHLNADIVAGHRYRYTWVGWGLISITFEKDEHLGSRMHIAANSEKRALRWQSTYPRWDPPSAWDWKAVTSHKRRLLRVLSSCA